MTEHCRPGQGRRARHRVGQTGRKQVAPADDPQVDRHAGAPAARRDGIDRVAGVSLMEFGTPEAMWHLDVTDFPAIVTMDAHGNSLHKDIEQASGERLVEQRT